MTTEPSRKILSGIIAVLISTTAATAQVTNMWAGNNPQMVPPAATAQIWSQNNAGQPVYAPSDLDQRLSGGRSIAVPLPVQPFFNVQQNGQYGVVMQPNMPFNGVGTNYQNQGIPFGYGAQSAPYGYNAMQPNGYGVAPYSFQGSPQPYGFGNGGYPMIPGGYGTPFTTFGNVPTGGSPFFSQSGFGMW